MSIIMPSDATRLQLISSSRGLNSLCTCTESARALVWRSRSLQARPRHHPRTPPRRTGYTRKINPQIHRQCWRRTQVVIDCTSLFFSTHRCGASLDVGRLRRRRGRGRQRCWPGTSPPAPCTPSMPASCFALGTGSGRIPPAHPRRRREAFVSRWRRRHRMTEGAPSPRARRAGADSRRHAGPRANQDYHRGPRW